MSQILVVDPDPLTGRWVESVLERDGFSVEIVHSGDDALKKIAQAPPQVIVLEVALPDMDGIDLIRGIRNDPATNGMGIVVLSSKMKISEIQAGLGAGADEYLAKRPGVDVELGPKIVALAAREPSRSRVTISKANGKAQLGKIISFCSAKGGAGTTSVCVNAAYLLARTSRNEVCVVDMALPLGMVGQSVGYESSQTIARLTQTLKGNLKPETVKPFVSAEPEHGFHILLGANDLSEANAIDTTVLGALFETLPQMYDYILVDLGRALTCAAQVVQASAAVVVVLAPEPTSVKMTKLVLQYFESLRISRRRVLLVNNRATSRAWMSQQEIENELGLALAATIPHELDYVSMAMQAGIPFVAKYPERAASQVFADFARSLVERTPR